jgi:predicted DCC family thiol-disulfide oxidoreductase YuxK
MFTKRTEPAGHFTLTLTDKLKPETRRIVFFDGTCNLCGGIVKFIMMHDRHRRFQFLPMQSRVAQGILNLWGITRMDEAVLLDDGMIYTGSAAGLRILRRLGGACKLLCAFAVVPRPVRDWIYRQISRRRYRWFGQTAACPMPRYFPFK